MHILIKLRFIVLTNFFNSTENQLMTHTTLQTKKLLEGHKILDDHPNNVDLPNYILLSTVCLWILQRFVDKNNLFLLIRDEWLTTQHWKLKSLPCGDKLFFFYYLFLTRIFRNILLFFLIVVLDEFLLLVNSILVFCSPDVTFNFDVKLSTIAITYRCKVWTISKALAKFRLVMTFVYDNLTFLLKDFLLSVLVCF